MSVCQRVIRVAGGAGGVQGAPIETGQGQAFAQAAAPHFKAETVPEVPGDGKSAGKVEPDEMKKFVHGLFNKD